MPRIFPEYKRSTVYGLIGAALHFSLMTLIFIFEFMGLNGENLLSWLIGFWDLPLFLLSDYIHVHRIFGENFMLYMGGTLLAAVEGWIVGFTVDMFLLWRFKNWGF